MADDARNNDQSPPSTRRGSDNSGPAAGQTSQNPSLVNSVLSEPGRRRPAPLSTQTEDYGTITRQISADPAPKPPSLRKPPNPRRISSQYPHKGQEFSVDDAQDEIDQLERQKRQDRIPKAATGTIRSQSTLRRRQTAQAPVLAQVASEDEEGDRDESGPAQSSEIPAPSADDDVEVAEPEVIVDDGDEDDGEVSDAESFTLKDRQEAINVTHPFGIRIWKPALYKKNRSVQKSAEDEIHSTPGLHVNRWLLFFNFLWTIVFGWWLALITFAVAIVCFLFGAVSKHSVSYAQVLWGLSGYLFYPFGKFVNLLQDEAYAEEDEGEGRSISEYEQWQSGDIEEGRLFFGPLDMTRSLIGRRRTSVESTDETSSLLGRRRRGDRGLSIGGNPKTRFFGRGKWNLGRVIFFFLFHILITPILLTVCGLCWFLVFTIPMGKVTWLLWDHLRRHPLALRFHSHTSDIRSTSNSPSSVLLCTYRAVGSKYWKFTIDGTNIFLFNLLGLVAFTIFDFYVLNETLHVPGFITADGFIFLLALLSIIPLAYFIGQAVASISAQSSMGVGATVNAFFSTVVEVFLYCVALHEGKAQLVEGSIIGSIFAGILFLPGLSMCFGALRRKTQRFNVKSAGVTSTMMLFAMIGCFGPTLFYQIYGSHELKCHDCKHEFPGPDRDCRRCFFSQVPAVHDRFYAEAVLPYIWFSAVALFLSYVIGLLFTLRTHAAIIWSTEVDEKRPDMGASNATAQQSIIHDSPEALTRQPTSGTLAPIKTDVRDTQLYQRILGQTVRQTGGSGEANSRPGSTMSAKSPHIVPPKARDDMPGFRLDRLTEAENQLLTRQMAEMAATAAVVATQSATKSTRKATQTNSSTIRASERPQPTRTVTAANIDAALHPEAHGDGGHNAPNWSKTKSSVILLTATVAYAVIAEILVDTVDAVLDNYAIDQKFLGITLFALVPNTTEFLNAISFAMNGNIALSMEIGSAYVLQVCLLQVPALVLFSAVHSRFIDPENVINYIFTLIFPQWDMVTVILCIFLLSYVYGEGKSNYFKGSILILAYCVVVAGFYFASLDVTGLVRGVDPADTLAVGSAPMLHSLVSSRKHIEL